MCFFSLISKITWFYKWAFAAKHTTWQNSQFRCQNRGWHPILTVPSCKADWNWISGGFWTSMICCWKGRINVKQGCLCKPRTWKLNTASYHWNKSDKADCGSRWPGRGATYKKEKPSGTWLVFGGWVGLIRKDERRINSAKFLMFSPYQQEG